MKKFKKIFLLLFSITLIGIVRINHADAGTFYYERGEGQTYFEIKDFKTYVKGDDIQTYFKSWLADDMTTIHLPDYLNFNNLDPSIDKNTVTGWQNIAELYNNIAVYNTNHDDYDKAKNIFSQLVAALGNYFASVKPNDNTPVITILSSPNAITLDPVKSSTITATITTKTGEVFTDTDLNKCFFYIGDGNSTYWRKDSVSLVNGKCSYTWTPDKNSVIGNHGVFVTLQKSSWTGPITYASFDTLPGNRMSSLVKVCQNSSCSAPTGGSFIATKYTVTLGSLESNPIFKVFESDPDTAQGMVNDDPGSMCYFYIGDNKGGWIRKGSSPFEGRSANDNNQPNCEYGWDYTGSPVGKHGFVSTYYDAGEHPTSAIKGASGTIYINVCASGTTNCQPIPDQPAGNDGPSTDGGSGGGGGGGGTTVGGFNGSVSGNDFMDKLKGEFKTLEDAFDFYIATNIIGLVAFIAVLVGGIMLLTAGGDPAKATKGKKSMIYGVVALIVGALSYGIVAYVINLVNTR